MAPFGLDFGSILDKFCITWEQKGAKREPKGGKGGQKGAKRERKGAKREPKGGQKEPKGAKMGAKINQKSMPKRDRSPGHQKVTKLEPK